MFPALDLDLEPYVWLFSPIIFGLGSSAILIPKNKIPKVRSKFNPPSWIFGIVWPILYLLLGYASYLVWKSNNEKIDVLLQKYILHVILLLLWWPIFIYFPNPFIASISLGLLTIYAIYLGWEFYKKNVIAGYCFIPYILWLCFATFLSTHII